MSTRMVWTAFVVGALALAVAIGFVEHASPDQDEHVAFTTLLSERRGLDQDIQLHALEARFDFSANYDQLARDDRDEQRLAFEATQQVPHFLREEERRSVESLLSRYADLAAQRTRLVEHFESENALLKNSLRYFPSLTSTLLLKIHDRELVHEINELRGATTALAVQSDARLGEQQSAALERVRQLGTKTLSASEQRELALMLSHARAIAEHKLATDRLLREMLALPLTGNRQQLVASYQAAHSRAERQARTFGHFVSALALVLLGIVAYAGLRLRRAALGLSRANERLELAVQERTAELKAEMAQNARMEVELRQAQKLEAVGQLASGIAHEINTPIQYVGDSIYFLREAFGEVMRLVDAYRGALEQAQAGMDRSAISAISAMRQVTDDIDLDMLRAEIPEAFERTADGTKQVASIVKAMKTFAHTSVEKAPLDLNSAVRNTLTVSRNEYKYVADVETELAVLPDVTCNAGGVRQVLLNLIVNAAHAIADVVQGSEQRGKIRITTERRGEYVVLAVSDTGGGIPEAIRQRIFEPFFTTKEPGRGSGQGLAISQSIVKQHGGKLRFETEPGRGTTFFVELPLEPAGEASVPEHAA